MTCFHLPVCRSCGHSEGWGVSEDLCSVSPQRWWKLRKTQIVADAKTDLQRTQHHDSITVHPNIKTESPAAACVLVLGWSTFPMGVWTGATSRGPGTVKALSFRDTPLLVNSTSNKWAFLYTDTSSPEHTHTYNQKYPN